MQVSSIAAWPNGNLRMNVTDIILSGIIVVGVVVVVVRTGLCHNVHVFTFISQSTIIFWPVFMKCAMDSMLLEVIPPWDFLYLTVSSNNMENMIISEMWHECPLMQITIAVTQNMYSVPFLIAVSENCCSHEWQILNGRSYTLQILFVLTLSQCEVLKLYHVSFRYKKCVITQKILCRKFLCIW
jgi:hypothetical protein